jgi:hypothetical protein
MPSMSVFSWLIACAHIRNLQLNINISINEQILASFALCSVGLTYERAFERRKYAGPIPGKNIKPALNLSGRAFK